MADSPPVRVVTASDVRAHTTIGAAVKRRCRWTLSVRTTGDQGSGILSSMSAANCFIVLAADQGNVDAGATVDVQPLEGLVQQSSR